MCDRDSTKTNRSSPALASASLSLSRISRSFTSFA